MLALLFTLLLTLLHSPIRFSLLCVLKLSIPTSASPQVLNRSRDNGTHTVDAAINGFIRMQLADRPPLPLATASTPGLGAHGVASRRLGRPGLKLSDIEGAGSRAKAAGLAQGRPSVLPPPRKPPSAGENGNPFANFSKIVCVSPSLLPLLYLYPYSSYLYLFLYLSLSLSLSLYLSLLPLSPLQRPIRCPALHRQGCSSCKGRQF